MPMQQPSNATTSIPTDAREDLTAAAALNDARSEGTPGDGGLGGAAAAPMSAGTGPASGAATPNSPLTPPVAAPNGADGGASEAQLLAAQDTPEPHPASR